MRTIIDSTGVSWTVFEVKRQGVGDRWSYLPEEFGDGWLCFESKFSKRRLTPVPPQWRDADDDELESLLARAQPVVRARFSTEDRPTAE